MLKETRFNEVRVNITSRANHIAKNGFPIDRENLSTPLPNEDGHIFWERSKPEYSALLSISTKRIVDRAIEAKEERNPFGLIKKDNSKEDSKPEVVTKINNFMDIYRAMSNTLDLSLDEEEKDPSSKPVWQRIQAIINTMENKFPNYEKGNVKERIKGGVGTACLYMAGYLEQIAKHASDKDPKNLIEIAKNSFPLIAKLAMMNSEKFLALDESISSSDLYDIYILESKFFKIENKRLAFSELGKFAIQDIEEDFTQENGDEELGIPITTGCPAMVSFDGQTSAVKDLWNWHLEIAEKVYPDIVSQLQNPRPDRIRYLTD